MNKGFLIVYNTCTISHQVNEADNIEVGSALPRPLPKLIDNWYRDLNTIYKQNFKDYKLVVSECRGDREAWNSNGKKLNMLNDFAIRIKSNNTNTDYNIINNNLSSNITFNHSIKEAVKRYGKFEYYMYVSSGIGFEHNAGINDPDLDGENWNKRKKTDVGLFDRIYNFLKEDDDIAMLNISAHNDNCFPPNSSHLMESLFNKPYHIKPGYSVNKHCAIYSNEFYEAYEEKLHADNYIGCGSEIAYPFLCAVINKKNLIAPYYICHQLRHVQTQDGKNPGVRNTDWFHTSLLHNFRGLWKSNDSKHHLTTDRIKQNLKDVGIKLCYSFTEQNQNQFLKEKDEDRYIKKFGKDGISISNDDKKVCLKVLKDNLFLSNDIINYNDIDNEYIKANQYIK